MEGGTPWDTTGIIRKTVSASLVALAPAQPRRGREQRENRDLPPLGPPMCHTQVGLGVKVAFPSLLTPLQDMGTSPGSE